MGNITIIAHDQVRERMAAPSIRCVEMARGLIARGHKVTLALPNDPEMDLRPIQQIRDDGPELTAAINGSDVIITGGGPYPESAVTVVPAHIPHVVDMSFPLLLEALEMHRVDPRSWPEARLHGMTQQMSDRLLRADVLLCASQEQRHVYLGWLAALGRLTGRLIEADPTVSALLRVVPFGCPSTVATSTGGGPRRSIEGVGERDFVLLWNGHVTDWYDPEMVLHAVASAARELPNLRLVFIGANAKDERLGRTPTGARTRALAQSLGLEGRHVFFWDEWIPYEQRADWLLDSDAAVVASPKTLEAELAVRARFLDCVWCATPLITTSGGTFADEVSRSELGLVVAPGDVGAMKDAIVTMARGAIRDEMSWRLQRLRHTYEWSSTLVPLLDFCDSPARAPDRDVIGHANGGGNGRRSRRLQGLFSRG